MLFVQDFAQNLLCVNHDEVQSAHWDHDRITIHPIIAEYICQTCQEFVKSEFIILSDDLKHDHDAVHTFQDAVEENLASSGVLIKKKLTYMMGVAQNTKKQAYLSSYVTREDSTHSHILWQWPWEKPL